MEWLPQRDAFCNSHNVPRPQLPLRNIAHWNAVLQRGTSSDDALHHERAYVAPGYFYMPVCDEPDDRTLAELSSLASTADWFAGPFRSQIRSRSARRRRYRSIHAGGILPIFAKRGRRFANSGRSQSIQIDRQAHEEG